MIFNSTPLAGAYVIDVEPIADDRGFFARSFCKDEFDAHGLSSHLVQCNISYNKTRGTLRGMHFQAPPHSEAKLIRCTHGEIFDVVVDLREGSKTFAEWFGVELTAENRKALYVPEGFAHGYLTMTDNAEVSYQVSEFYNPLCESGISWNDSRVNIAWPIQPVLISEKDRGHMPIKPLSIHRG
jgi:dTDP-4-dehydrorhamnose 3,5-epimerase